MPRLPGSAFSFAELLVAFAVLAMALVPLFVMETTTRRRAVASEPTIMATMLAAEVAEQLRLQPIDALPRRTRFAVRPGTGAFQELRVTGRGGRGRSQVPPILLVLGRYPLEAEVTAELAPLSPPDLLGRLTVLVSFQEGTPPRPAEVRHVEVIHSRVATDDGTP